MRDPRMPRHRSPRRGVTLVEMMVAVALLVLMMTVIVTIFTAATGAVSGMKAYQELDANLRQLDSIIRQDLQGVTAHLTPPLNPKDNYGYLEYGENQFADLQGEDTDDYIRFTAKAPEGQVFTGRAWVASAPTGSPNQPLIVTSQYAEIIYFLRNGNLYRRVLLVAPDRQTSIYTGAGTTFNPQMLGALPTSWQGVNDLSARPGRSGSLTATPIILNTLGDLTNRENRFAHPRFADDFLVNSTGAVTGNVGAPGDGVPDDENSVTSGSTTTYPGDGVHDYYPTLYPHLFDPMTAPGLVFELPTASAPARLATLEAMAFPYIFPAAFSKPDVFTGSLGGAGWINSVDPSTTFTSSATTTTALAQLLNLNHAPLDLGDNLPLPASAQTWWGFPTWRETMSPNWTDPTIAVAAASTGSAAVASQANYLHPFSANSNPFDPSTSPPLSVTGTDFLSLPPMTTPTRLAAQPNSDGLGSTTLTTPGFPALWSLTWEEDLVMTNVRSFDIKIYDDLFPGYVDLGWGDDLRVWQPFPAPTATPPLPPTTPPFIAGVASYPTYTGNSVNPCPFPWPPTAAVTNSPDIYRTFAHEGRIPPLVADARFDPQLLRHTLVTGDWYAPPYSGFTYTGNVGDDDPSVIRLRRVWDSWSTTYTESPATGKNPVSGLEIGPPNGSPPIYPSYPPPYPAPMRGIQIQVRVVDSQNQRIKTLTIRQDFSDKL